MAIATDVTGETKRRAVTIAITGATASTPIKVLVRDPSGWTRQLYGTTSGAGALDLEYLPMTAGLHTVTVYETPAVAVAGAVPEMKHVDEASFSVV
jgi:hypothetical protein